MENKLGGFGESLMHLSLPKLLELIDVAEKLGVRMCWGSPIAPGDLYIAMRNQKPQLFECKRIRDGMIDPKGVGYPYDADECVKVVEVAHAGLC